MAGSAMREPIHIRMYIDTGTAREAPRAVKVGRALILLLSGLEQQDNRQAIV